MLLGLFSLPAQFEWNGELKDISSSFVGVSPEFEMALYTLLFLLDQVGVCVGGGVVCCGPLASGGGRGGLFCLVRFFGLQPSVRASFSSMLLLCLTWQCHVRILERFCCCCCSSSVMRFVQVLQSPDGIWLGRVCRQPAT